jgi:hypothetical protein
MKSKLVTITFLFCLTLSIFRFADAGVGLTCSWNSQAQDAINKLATSASALPEDLKPCHALSVYFESYLSELQIKKSPLNADLFSMARDKTMAAEALWVLDAKRDEYVDHGKTTTYGQVLDSFEEYMAKYFTALGQYLEKRKQAAASADPKVILDWSLNEQIYRMQLTSADSEWVAMGHKTEILNQAFKEKSAQKKK